MSVNSTRNRPVKHVRTYTPETTVLGSVVVDLVDVVELWKNRQNDNAQWEDEEDLKASVTGVGRLSKQRLFSPGPLLPDLSLTFSDKDIHRSVDKTSKKTNVL